MKVVTNIEEYNKESVKKKMKTTKILKWTGIFGLLNIILFSVTAYFSDSLHRTKPFFQEIIPRRSEIISSIIVIFLPACIMAAILFSFNIKRRNVNLLVKIFIAIVLYFLLLFPIYQFHF